MAKTPRFHRLPSVSQLQRTEHYRIDKPRFAAAGPHLGGLSSPSSVAHERITSVGLGKKVRRSIRFGLVRR